MNEGEQEVFVSMDVMEHLASTTEGTLDEKVETMSDFLMERLKEGGMKEDDDVRVMVCEHGVTIQGPVVGGKKPRTNPKKYSEGWERIFGSDSRRN